MRSLSETIRLDSRTKLLNPKWYEGMLDSGYEGVREVAKRLNFTLGWSATSGAVDNFVYEEANETFINDPEMRKRLLELNPNSFRQIVGTLLEVHGRGYWETSDENIEQLQELYQELRIGLRVLSPTDRRLSFEHQSQSSCRTLAFLLAMNAVQIRLSGP